MLKRILPILIFGLFINFQSHAQLICNGSVNSNYNGEDISCNGANDGEVTVNVTGGSGNYSYGWVNGPSTPTWSGLGAGTYTVIVNDIDNPGQLCFTNVSLTEPAPLTVVVFNITPPSCNEIPDGSGTAILSGAVGTTNYVWGNGETGFTAIQLTTGSNQLTVTDANSCTFDTTFNINVPTPIYPEVTVTNELCQGNCDGEVISNPLGGNGNPYNFVWEDAGNNIISNVSSANNLCVGTYQVSVTDFKGCSGDTVVVVGTPTPISILPGASSNATCSYNCDGSSEVSISGGSPPYVGIEWFQGLIGGGTNTGLTGLTNNQLCPDTDYYVKVTDNGGCEQFYQITPITSASAIDINTDTATTNLGCNGINDGLIFVSLSGGNSALTPTWTTLIAGSGIIAGDEDQTGLGQGKYKIVVEDNIGCKDSAEYTINEPLAIISDGTVTNIGCSGGSDGQIQLNLSGGTGTLISSWISSAVGFTDPGTYDIGPPLDSGTYSLSITDDNNCTYDTTFTIIEPGPIYANGLKTDVGCFGNADGTINLNPSNNGTLCGTATEGGDIILTAPTGAVFTSITFASYGLPNGTCGSFTQDIACHATTSLAEVQAIFIGNNSGTITADNGTFGDPCPGILKRLYIQAEWTLSSAYTFNWTGPSGYTSSDEDITALDTGTYNVTITDNLTCTMDTSITINQPDSIDISGTSNDILCNGDVNGQINVTINGGNPPVNWTWTSTNGSFTDPGGNATNLSGLEGGTYTISVIDDKGCTKDTALIINEPDPIVPIPVLINNVSCAGLADGSATVLVVGGTAAVDFNYSWTNGQTAATATNLSAGTYTITVTDDNNCRADSSVTITDPLGLTATHTIDNEVTCNGLSDGSATVNPTGGNIPYTYLWSDGQTSATANNLSAGTYTCTVTDNGINSWSLNYSEDFDGAVGPEWTDNSTETYRNTTVLGEFNSNSTGQPTLNLTGLPAHDSIRVVFDFYAFDTWNGNNIGTVGPDIWSVDIDGISVLSTTFHKDANNTQSYPDNYPASNPGQTGAVATNLESLNLSAGSGQRNKTQKFFINETIVHTANNASISLSDQLVQNIDNDSWGIDNIKVYLFEPSAIDACTHIETIIINEPDPLTITASKISDVICNDELNGSAQANATGGSTPYTYVWSNGSGDNPVTNLSVGTFTVTVTDSNGCQEISNNVTINEPTVLSVSISSPPVIGGFQFVGEHKNQYLYYHAGQMTWPNARQACLNEGGDMIVISDSLDNATYSNIFTQAGWIGLFQNTSSANYSEPFGGWEWVDGSTIDYIGNGTSNTPADWAEYQNWQNPANGADPNRNEPNDYLGGPETYGEFIANPGYNFWNDLYETSSNPFYMALDKSSTSVTNVSCFGGSDGTATATTVGGTIDYDYLWNDGQTTATANNLSAGQIIIVVTDDNGCTASDTAQVTEPPEMQLTATVVDVVCNGTNNGSITLSPSGGSGGFDYDWDTDGTGDNDDPKDLTGLLQGTYNLTLFDSANNICTIDTFFTITEPSEIFIGPTIITEISCADSSNGGIDISPFGGTTATLGSYTFDWDNDGTGDNDDTQNLSGIGGGTYIIKIIDDNACEKDSTISINTIPTISFNPTVSTSNCGLDNGSISVAAIGGNTPYGYSWDNGETNNSITSLFQGSYVLTLSYTGNDGANCGVDTTFNLVDNPAAIDATFVADDESCFGSCDGNIAATITNALAPITYTWSSTNLSFINDGNPNQFNLCEGTYYLDMVDGNLCPFKDTLVVNSQAEIVTNETITNVNCGGDSTGAISIVVTGGLAPTGYQYSWVGQNTGFTSINSNISTLVSDDYFLTVTDDDGCSDTATYIVTENNTLTIIDNVVPASCGIANGSANVTVSGGVEGAGYQFVWRDNTNAIISNTNSVSSVAAGIYTFTVTDAVNCLDSITINISDLSQSTMSVDSIKHESCAGDADGLITVLVNPNPTPWSLSWTGPAGFTDPGGSNTTINNLGSGQYIATLTDGAGCTLQEVVDINEAQSLTVNVIQQDPTCFGDNDGSIDIFVSGGNVAVDYTYDWNNDGTGDNDDTQDLSNLGAGTYVVNIYDDAGCSINKSYNLQEPTELIGSSNASLTGCGLNDGSAQVTVSGGSPAYTYTWTDGSGLQVGATNSIVNQAAGCYNINVEDDKGCLFNDIACISNPTGPTISLDNVDTILCYGNSNGAVFVTVSGANIPFIYDWQVVDAGITNNQEDLQNVKQGTYSITVTDTLGCVTGASFNVPQPDSIEVNYSKIDLSCFGNSSGEIDLTISGGSQPYNINWTGPAGFVDPGSEDLLNLSQGIYDVSGTDDNGCTITSTSITIDEPSDLSISLSATTTACNQPTGSVTISGSGGSLSSLDYNYELTDLAGLTVSSSAVTLNLAQGQYIGFIYDDNLCFAKDTIEVSLADSPLITLNNIEDADCAGNPSGSIYITVTGSAVPFSYQWNGSVSPDAAHQTVEDFEDWFAGTYQVAVTDTNGCLSTLGGLIIEQPINLFATENVVNPLCSDGNTGSISLTPSGGTTPFTYEWSEDGITFSNSISVLNLDSGSYSYTITDSNNCIHSNTITLTPPSALSLSESTVSSTCGNSNGTASVIVTGGSPGGIGYSYSWSNAVNGNPIAGSTNSLTNQTSGIYEVVVSDPNGCSESINITVSDSDGPTIVASSSNIACFGSINGTINLTITGNGGYNFVWTGPAGFVDPGTQNLTGLDPGNYSVFVTDGNGCSSAQNVVVDGPGGAIQVQSTITDINCYDDASGEIAINVIGGTPNYTYSWTGPNGFTSTDEDLTGLDSGQYVLDILDLNGCPLSGTVFDITQPTAIVIDTNIIQPTCDSTDGILFVTVSGGTLINPDYTYDWDDISTPEANKSFTDSLIDIGAGNYQITVTDDNGCSAIEVIAISDLNGPTLSSVKTDVDCVGDDNGTIDLTISPTGNYSIDWDNDGTGDDDDNEDLVSLIAGNYNVVVEDLTSGCKSSLSVSIDVANTLAVTLTPSSLSCNNDTNGTITTLVTGGTPGYNFDWTLDGFNVSTDQDPTDLSAGNYLLTLTDDNGCQKTDSAEITEPTTISLLQSSINSSCGQADGSVSVIASGGSVASDYTYSWSNISGGTPGFNVGNTATVNNLVSGSYQVSVYDDNLCVSSVPVAISDDNAPSVSFNVTDVECFGDSTGVIDLTVVGIPSFSYNWTGPNGFSNTITDSITNLISGSYNVVVTDGNGCTRTKNIVVDGPINGLSLDSSTTDLTCNGDSTGSISVQINGGTAPFQTIWSGPSGFSSTSEDLTALDTGSYNLTVIDDAGCQLINNVFYVSQPDSISISEVITPPTCNALDGSISIIASGGTAATNYQYSWDNLTTPAFGIGILTSLSNIGAGNYQVTVTDDENCQSSKVFSIANANAPTLTAEVTNIDCNGNANGSIDLTVSGTSSYTVDWDNDGVGDANDNEDLNNLSAGTYSVTIKDLTTGCVSVLSEDIIDPDPISIGSTVIDILCNGDNDGAIDVFLAGGSGPLTPTWTTIVAGNGIVVSDTNQSGLGKGTYQIVVNDTNACVNSLTFNIEESDTISVSSVLNDVQCSDSLNGSIIVISNGGTGTLVPSWSSSVSTFTDPSVFNLNGLDSGSYTISILDDNNCTFDTTFILIKPSEILAIAQVVPVDCFGNANGEITLNPFGGTGSFNTNWSGPNGFSSVDNNLIGLDTGSYSLNIIDDLGCSKDTLIEIGQPDEISLSAVITNTNCFGDTNGKIKLSIAGGSSPYAYDWAIDGVNDFDDLDSLINLSANSYPLSILDNNNCTVDSTFIVTEPAQISLSATIDNNLCSNDSIGAITTNAAGGTGTLSYNWSTLSGFSSVNSNISSLHTDTFSLSVTDVNLCVLDTSFAITAAAAIYANITVIDANCGLSDGSATASPSGGTISTGSDYIYDWDNDGTGDNNDNASIGALIAGNYNLTILDDNGCSIDTSIVILNTSGPSITVDNITNPTCFGGSDGAISISISGGNQPYVAYWNPNHYTQGTNLNNIGSGNHIVKVIDNVGCESLDTVSLIDPPKIIINTGITNSTCGVCNGSAIATISGGNIGASFSTSWSNGSTGNLASGLCSGVYTVSVTDVVSGCLASEQFTVSDDLLGITETISVTPPSCANLSDGSISVTASGGAGPYSYIWLNNGNTSNTLNNIGNGDYYLMINDDNGCSKTITATLVSTNTPITVEAQINPTECGLSTGSISIIPSGGSGAYSYLWSNGNNTNTLSGLSSGSYSVTINDGNGCAFNNSYGVSSVSDLSVSLGINDILCQGDDSGSLTASVSGNIGAITETWSDAAGNILGNSSTINNLSSGNYLYSVVENSSGCEQYAFAEVSEGNKLLISLSNTLPSSCEASCDGSASLVVAGGLLPLSYVWDNGGTSSSESNLCAGNQTILVSDANGCQIQQSISIGENNDLSASYTTLDATCGACDGQANVSPNGGSGSFTITWYDGSLSASHNNLCAGVYGLNISDDNTGCNIMEAVNISNSSGPSNQIVSTVDPSCFGSNNGSASVAASGGVPPYSYFWVPGGQTTQSINNVSAGNYFLEIVDDNNCLLVVPVTLSDPASTEIEAVVVDASCSTNNGYISIISYGNGGSYSYSWTGPNGFTSTNSSIENLGAGQYFVAITDLNGCVVNEIFNINSTDTLRLNLNKTDVACYGDSDGSVTSVITNGSGNYTYSWSNGSNSADLNGVSAGIYGLTVTDNSSGCIAASFTNIVEPDSIALSSSIIIEPDCFGDANGVANIIPMGGNNIFSVLWVQSGAIGFSQANLSAGNYNVIITDQNNCVSNQSISIDQPDSINIIIDQVIDAYCQDQNDGQISISVNGGTGSYQYNWIDSAGTFSSSNQDLSGLLPGTYFINVLDFNSCSSADSVVVGATNTVLALAGVDTNICVGQCLDIIGSSSGSNTVSYQWNIIDSTNVISSDSIISNFCFNDTNNITFELTISDQNCSNTDSITVFVNDLPAIDAGLDSSDIFGTIFNLGGAPTGPTGSSYSWSPTTNFIVNDSTLSNPEIELLSDAVYLVTVIDANGCINSDNIVVTLIPEITYPSGFSPNGDGINELWTIDQIEQFPECVIEIYNRWGSIVFRSANGYPVPWGGENQKNGKILPLGTYYYIINLNDDKFPDVITGPITIIK